jgi:hypothetical protein
MARMSSPAGDMEMKIASIDVVQDQMVIGGKFGVWDAKIYVGPQEVRQMMSMLLKLKVIGFVLRLPFMRAKPATA